MYLAPFAGLTGAARLPIGPLRARPESRAVLERACAEVEALARGEGVRVADGLLARIRSYVDTLPSSTRSSLLNVSGGTVRYSLDVQTPAGGEKRCHTIDAWA